MYISSTKAVFGFFMLYSVLHLSHDLEKEIQE